MRDRIIKWLGGVPKKEFEFCESQLKITTYHLHGVEHLCDFLRDELKEKSARINYFEDLILKQTNLVHDPGQQRVQENLNPINTKPKSITHIMRDMQKDDRARVKGNQSA